MKNAKGAMAVQPRREAPRWRLLVSGSGNDAETKKREPRCRS
jgi:hypothetical protein